MIHVQNMSKSSFKPRFRIRQLAAVFCVVATVAFAISYCHRTFMLGIGPVTSEADWPIELRQMLQRLSPNEQSQVKQIKVFSLGPRDDPSFLWRVDGPRSVFDTLCKDFDLRAEKPEELPSQFWSMHPQWWFSGEIASTLAARTLSLPAPEQRVEGLSVVAIYDPESHATFAWSQFNF
jgi:hypothetical protein